MPPRSNSPPPTKRPPPDPIDAAREALDRSIAAGKAFRDADDFDDPTGRFEAQPQHFHVHVDPPEQRAPLASVTDADIPKTHSGLVGALATLIAAAVAAAVAKLLGKV